jgi:hypothetical protein
MTIVEWALLLIPFVFLALGVFGSIAKHFLKPTRFIRFCQRLWLVSEKGNLMFASIIMVLFLAVLVIVVIAKVFSR